MESQRLERALGSLKTDLRKRTVGAASTQDREDPPPCGPGFHIHNPTMELKHDKAELSRRNPAVPPSTVALPGLLPEIRGHSL